MLDATGRNKFLDIHVASCFQNADCSKWRVAASGQVTPILCDRCHSNAGFRCGLSRVETAQTERLRLLFNCSNVIISSKPNLLKRMAGPAGKIPALGHRRMCCAGTLPYLPETWGLRRSPSPQSNSPVRGISTVSLSLDHEPEVNRISDKSTDHYLRTTLTAAHPTCSTS